MVLAYYLENPDISLSFSYLKEKLFLEYFKFDSSNETDLKDLEILKNDRRYTYEDQIRINKDIIDYEKKAQVFFTEHMHSDEEIRYVLDGCGYFDVRDMDDKWIRILVEKNDLIILPAGVYHRFKLDDSDNAFIKVSRFFIGEPVWTPLNRPSDKHPVRIEYVKKLNDINGL